MKHPVYESIIALSQSIFLALNTSLIAWQPNLVPWLASLRTPFSGLGSAMLINLFSPYNLCTFHNCREISPKFLYG